MLSFARHDTLIELCRSPHGMPDHVLVIAEYEGSTILVRNRTRGRWELPGGLLEPGDDATKRAAIEFFEETGQRASRLQRCAVAVIRDGLTGHVRSGVVFLCRVPQLVRFRPNAETSGITLWRPGALDTSGEIDQAALTIMARCRAVRLAV